MHWAGRFRRQKGAALLKDEEIADVMDANQNVQVKRGYLPKEAYLLLQEMQDECAKDVEAFTMRSHTDRFAQLRHDALWHQCHGFNWDLSGGELHIIADELNYWAMLLQLPLATYRNYEPLRTQYHNMKRMGPYCGHSRGIPISCQTEERMSHPAVVYFVQQWRGRIETTTSATKQASLRQIAELHLASNGPDKEAMHHPHNPSTTTPSVTPIQPDQPSCVFALCRINPTTSRQSHPQRNNHGRGNSKHHRRQQPKERQA